MMTTLKLAAMTKISNEHVKPLTSQAKSCSPTDMNVGEGDRVKPGSTWIKFPTLIVLAKLTVAMLMTIIMKNFIMKQKTRTII